MYTYRHVKCFALCKNDYIWGQGSWLSWEIWSSTQTSLSNKECHSQQLRHVENFCLKVKPLLFYKVVYATVELLILKILSCIFELKSVPYNAYICLSSVTSPSLASAVPQLWNQQLCVLFILLVWLTSCKISPISSPFLSIWVSWHMLLWAELREVELRSRRRWDHFFPWGHSPKMLPLWQCSEGDMLLWVQVRQWRKGFWEGGINKCLQHRARGGWARAHSFTSLQRHRCYPDLLQPTQPLFDPPCASESD